MFLAIILTCLLAGGVGVVWKKLTDAGAAARFGGRRREITWPEVAVESLVMLVIVAPLVSWLGYRLAVASQVTFNENLNGFEVAVRIVKYRCYKTRHDEPQPAKHTYKGDPYLVTETSSEYDFATGRTVTRTRDVFKFHTIPYTTEEWDYVIDTTLGPVTIAERNFPPDPQAYRFTCWKAVPRSPLSALRTRLARRLSGKRPRTGSRC